MKKYLILAAIVVVLIVDVVLVMKFYPLWVTLQNVVVLAVGVAVGWIARWLWSRYNDKTLIAN